HRCLGRCGGAHAAAGRLRDPDRPHPATPPPHHTLIPRERHTAQTTQRSEEMSSTTSRTRRLTSLVAAGALLAGAGLVGQSGAALAADAPAIVTVTVADTSPRGDDTVPFSSTGSWLSSALTSPEGGPSRYSI